MKIAQSMGGLTAVWLLYSVLFSITSSIVSSSSPWTWICSPEEKICLKQRRDSGHANQSEEACRLGCAPENYLWPLPNHFIVGESYTSFNPNMIQKEIEAPSEQIKDMINDVIAIHVTGLIKNREAFQSPFSTRLSIKIQSSLPKPNIEMDESYTLEIKMVADDLHVGIVSETFFGARHAIETLFQLSQYDRFSSSFIISNDVKIKDAPYYPHRGVMIDTARNFIPVDKLKKVIDSMSYSKLNVFHWHITDSQSFPLVMESLPDFAKFGAYSPEKTYTRWDVDDIVHYAAVRGVRVLPELDAPAHVGAGWEAVDPSYTLCINKEPWTEWCIEPPCGQLNPASDGMYDILENIYAEFIRMFGDVQFHMGGDEIHVGCWNASSDVLDWLQSKGRGREEEDIIYIWNHFLQESVTRIKKAGMSNPNIILWNNGMTKAHHIHLMDPKIFTIQIWTDSRDLKEQTIKTVAENGFKMIFSNYDSTYLDCGFGGWVSDGNNWCAPYKEWQRQHQNDPIKMLEERNLTNLEEAKSNILGGEVALWTEQIDEHSMMSRLEPRAAAYGERLWRGPNTGGWLEAERRLVRHRVRLAERGIAAETLTHGWCRQNEGKCILGVGLDTDTEF